VAGELTRSCASLQVAFSLQFPGIPKAFTPQQVFVSLRNRASGALAVVAAKAAGSSSPNDYSATVTSDIVAKQIGKQVKTTFLKSVLSVKRTCAFLL
jgi:hypothetical protein